MSCTMSIQYETDFSDVFQKLGLEKVSIIGWHDGGAAAMIAAARYPNLVQNLVIWGAYAYVTQKDIDIYNGKYCMISPCCLL